MGVTQKSWFRRNLFCRVTPAQFIRYLKSFYKATLDINKPLRLWVFIYTLLNFRTFGATRFQMNFYSFFFMNYYLSLVLFLLLNTYDIFFPFNVFQILIKQIFPSQTLLLICSKILQELLYCHKRKVLVKTRRQILNKN